MAEPPKGVAVPPPGAAPLAGAPASSLLTDDWGTELEAWESIAFPLVDPSFTSSSSSSPSFSSTSSSSSSSSSTFISASASNSVSSATPAPWLSDADVPGLFEDPFDLPSEPQPPPHSSAPQSSTPRGSRESELDRAPPPDPRPDFPERTLPEMTEEAWADDIHRLVTLDVAESPTDVLRAPTRSYWQGLAALLRDEREHENASAGARGLFDLELASARVADALGDSQQARAHLDAALAWPGLSSLPVQATAAHRARLCLAERDHRLDDEEVRDSLHRLCFTPHPDQPTYRALRAEWTLAHAATGEVDATAAAQIPAVPEGLARGLAEAELVWHHPATAAAVLELVAERTSSRRHAAALLEVAGALSESAGDFHAAADQRGIAASLGGQAGDRETDAGGFGFGALGDLARLPPDAAAEAVWPWVATLPPGEFKDAVAHWAHRLARRSGLSARETFAQVGIEVESMSPTLLRDCADALTSARSTTRSTTRSTARPTTTGPLEHPSRDAVFRALAARWPEPAARLCLVWQVCVGHALDALDARRRASGLEDERGMEDPLLDRLVDVLLDGERAPPPTPPRDRAPLAAAFQLLAHTSVEDSDHQLRWLERWAEVDPARRLPARMDLVDALIRRDRSAPGLPLDQALIDLAKAAPLSTAAWRLATRAAGQGRFAEAAEWLLQLAHAPGWRESPAAAALIELANERSARARLAAATAFIPRPDRPAVEELGPAVETRNDEKAWGTGSPASLVDRLITSSGLSEVTAMWPVQPGPPAFWSAVQAVWTALADENARGLTGSTGEFPRTTSARSPAAELLVVAEREESRGDRAGAVRLFQEAASALDGAAVLGDAVAGQFRCGAIATLWPAGALERPGQPGISQPIARQAERAVLDLEALAAALRARRWEDAIVLLTDVPPHEREASAQTWALAASVAGARLAGAPALAERLWMRAQALAVRARAVRDPGDSAAPQPALDPELEPEGIPLLAFFRAADPGVETDPIRRSRAQERLAQLAAAARAARSQDDLSRSSRTAQQALVTREPSEDDSAALFLWLAAGGGRIDAGPGPRPETLTDSDSSETERRLWTSVEGARHRSPAEGGATLFIPAAMAWRRWLTRAGRAAEASAAAAEEARAFVDPELEAVAWLRAARLAEAAATADPTSSRENRSVSQEKIQSFLEEVLKVSRGHGEASAEAFTWLREIYSEAERPRELVELLARRIASVGDAAAEVAELRLELAGCFAGPLADPVRAKAELARILAAAPQHRRALAQLAALEERTGNALAATRLLIARAKVERSADELCQIFLRLGSLYADALAEPKLAVAAFNRVLEIDPADREALERLSQLYAGLGEARNGLVVTQTLASSEPDAERRARHLLALGRFREKLGDSRGALASCRQAADLSPSDTTVLAELIRLLDANHDVIGRRFALDHAATRLRAALRSAPDDVAAGRALAAVMGWRGRPAAAAALTEWSAWTSSGAAGATYTSTTAASATAGAEPGSLAAAAAASPPPRDLDRLRALTRPEIEDQVFAADVPSSVRRLFRTLGPLLWEGGPQSLGPWGGIDRGGRLVAGKTGRQPWDRLARALGVEAFELFVMPSRPASGAGASDPARLAVLPGRPPIIVVGAELATAAAPPPVAVAAGATPGSASPPSVAGSGVADADAGLRFAAASSLYAIATGLVFAMEGDVGELAAWLSGVLRQFLPDYAHPAATPARARERATRFARIISRRHRHDLMPFALECSGALDLEWLRVGIGDACNRVGLLASGRLVAAVRTLLIGAGRAAAPGLVSTSPEAVRLLEFAMSDGYDDLVAAVDSTRAP